ncbi:ROK family protein [Kaistia sp. UC242_56]|uniref:ROK family transcriptional regulator n=1 Tax=Kaistia sp. UC242_56 TaxID=3374625 RepID=UPI0037BDA18B
MQNDPDRSDIAAAASGAPLLSLIASGRAQSRAELIDRTGLSRTTVTQRLNALIAAGLVDEAPKTLPSGGRPTRVLEMNTGFGVILVADVGESILRTAVTTLEPAILAESTCTIDLSDGPLPVLERIAGQFLSLLDGIGRPRSDLLAAGLCLPAPVDFGAGRVFGPSILTGWDNFDIRSWLGDAIGAPVVVENDVNLMTLSESRRFWPEVEQLLFIKAGTGIGSGIIADGRLYRGAQGAAGDIGHIQLNSADPPLCRCGKLGCVEARAAGWALARDLRAKGFEAENARDIVALVHANQPEAIRCVREAGRVLGEVTADVVSVLNPSTIVIGGTLSGAADHLLSGVRQLVFERSLPLATRELQIVRAKSDGNGGILGAAQLAIDTILRPETIEGVIVKHARFARR